MENENFLRRYILKAGGMGGSGFEIGNIESASQEALHISFSIEKSNAESPNDANVQIWNLSPANLNILEEKDCVVELKAGYGNNMALLLVGNVFSVITTMDGADRMTELQVVDGLAELRDAALSISINGQVNCKEVYEKIADAMGVSIVFANDLSYNTLPNGFSYVGNARNALQKLAGCCGHEWTIQNQVLQVTWPGRAVSAKGYLLDSDSGLVGIPKRISIGSGEEEMTGWEVEYFLNGAIEVNDIVQLHSSVADGYFLVHKVTMDGDNMEGDWICTAQLLMIASMPELDQKASSDGIKEEEIKKGDKVKVIRTVQSGNRTRGYQYSGGMFVCYYPVYDVIQVKGERVVIGVGNTVTAAVHIKDLEKA